MHNDDRAHYADIKNLLLNYFFRGCRDHGFSGWSASQVLAWVYGELEDTFRCPLEELMLEVVMLVLTGNWLPDQVVSHRLRISDLLEKNDLSKMLVGVPAEEAGELLTDLQVLGIATSGL